MFWGGCEFSITLGSLFSDAWGCVGCLAWGFPALQVVGWGPALVPKGEALGELLLINIPCNQILWPPSELPFPPQETLQEPYVGLSLVPMEALFCAQSQCTWDPVCVFSKSVVCFPPAPSPLEHLHSSLAGIQSQTLWGSCSWCRTPRLGSLLWGLDFWVLGENLCNPNYSFICGLPTQGCGS